MQRQRPPSRSVAALGDRERVEIENDLREGLVTPEAAARDYGFSISEEAAE